MTAKIGDGETQRETYTVPEAARRLGLSRNAAYEAAKRGELPTLKIGGRLIVPIAAFEKMLASVKFGGVSNHHDDPAEFLGGLREPQQP